MANHLNRRVFTRYDYEVPVTLHTGIHKGKDFLEDKSQSILATLSNYSQGGMYFESLFYMPPGTSVTVTLASAKIGPMTGESKVYHTQVKWCRKIVSETQTLYGIGAMYDSRVNSVMFGFGRSLSPGIMISRRTAGLRVG